MVGRAGAPLLLGCVAGLLALLAVVGRGRGSALLQEGAPVSYASRGAARRTEQLTHYAVGHAALGQPQVHEVARGGDMGDEVIDMPIANHLHDDGDMHVSADQMDSYTFKQRKPAGTSQLRTVAKKTRKTQALQAVIAGAPSVADPSDDSMYETKLEKLGVNVGSKPSEHGFSTQGDTFIKSDGLESSYSLAPTPQREHNGNTIGGDFFGHVGDMPWTKEQIQAQVRRRHTQARHTQALATVPAAVGSSANGWCECASAVKGEEAQCQCHGADSKKAKTMSLNMACCECGGAISNSAHPTYVAPAKACALCSTDCSKEAYSPLYNPYGRRNEDESPRVEQLRSVRGTSRVREPFFKMHEQPGSPTRGMLALNKIIEGSRHFKTPPPTKDVYKTVTKKMIHRDPLVAAS